MIIFKFKGKLFPYLPFNGKGKKFSPRPLRPSGELYPWFPINN